MSATTALVDELSAHVGGTSVLTDLDARQAASRDHAWMSPILAEDLPASTADVVVVPRSAADVAIVTEVAHRHHVPVTVRGRGTGNYGQAVPFDRGIVVDMSECTVVRDIDGDTADVEAGVTFSGLEKVANARGLEVAVMPSMLGSTMGGFLSGGNQGIGSIENGSIWDGWVTGLDVVGVRPPWAAFTVEGDAVADHLHTYGTGGVLTGMRVRLRPARRRTVLFAAFDRFAEAATAGRALMDLDPAPRVVSVDDPAIVPTMPLHPGLDPERAMLRAAVEVGTVDEARRLVADHGGRVTAVDPAVLPGLYGSIYNHATLRAKRVDPSTCAVQVRGRAVVEHGGEVRAAFPDARLHLDGNAPAIHGKGYSGLLLASWTGREDLAAGMARLRDLGVRVINPHTWYLGGHGDVERLREVAARVDPDGLLNPGKLPPVELPV